MPTFSLLQLDSEDGDDIENVPEPDHPLGFGAQNHCKWMNSSADTSTGQSWYGFDISAARGDNPSEFQQSYPPLSSYICKDTVSTRALLLYHQSASDDNKIQNAEAPFLWRHYDDTYQSTTLDTKTNTLANSVVLNKSIKEAVDLERQKLQKQHREENHGLQTIVKNLEQETSFILKERRERAEMQKEEEERIKREESKPQKTEPARKSEAAPSAKGNSNTTGVAIDNGKSAGLRGKEKDQCTGTKDTISGKRADHGGLQNEKKTSQTPEHILKGKKLISQLVKLRQSIEPFDKNKAVSKRRLTMKKTIRGKLNTLSESAAKVQEVCAQVNAAISAARQEDAQIKEAIKQGRPGFTPDMACGKRYIVDLFASNVIQRVQAEGFNGPRGDGFPLAAMVAMVASENKDVIPVLVAHIYTVCRIAIPSLPDAVASADENEFMVSLGMIRDKTGEFESWDRFSSRTENIISIMANIQASMPSTHSLLGGHNGAAEWLKRFLESLPPPPTSPLPLLAAPVLHAFLSGAGCMLADKYEDLFKRSLATISEDILNRLDQGEIGKPSFIRLSKAIEKGYDGFRSSLPPKAIPEMYNSSANAGIREIGGVHGNKKLPSSPFGGGNPSMSASYSNGSVQSNTFCGSSVSTSISTNNNAGSNPFGINPRATPNPFGSSSSGDQMNQFNSAGSNSSAKATSFGFGSQDTAPSTSGWASAGNKPSGGHSFGAAFGNTQNSNPFAAQGGNAQGPSGMSSSPFTSNAFFGSGNQVQTNTTPFGSSNHARTNPTSFGSSNQAQTSTTPFGSSNEGQIRASPFGSSNRASAGSSPFGSSNRATTSASPFGSNSGNNNRKSGPPCKFFSKGQCRFGDKCKFSHDSGNNSSGFSWNQAGNSNNNRSNNNNNSRMPSGGGFSSNQRNPFA